MQMAYRVSRDRAGYLIKMELLSPLGQVERPLYHPIRRQVLGLSHSHHHRTLRTTSSSMAMDKAGDKTVIICRQINSNSVLTRTTRQLPITNVTTTITGVTRLKELIRTIRIYMDSHIIWKKEGPVPPRARLKDLDEGPSHHYPQSPRPLQDEFFVLCFALMRYCSAVLF